MGALPSPHRQTGRYGPGVGSAVVSLDRDFTSLGLSFLASKIKEQKRWPLRSLPGDLCDLGGSFCTDDVCPYREQGEQAQGTYGQHWLQHFWGPV